MHESARPVCAEALMFISYIYIHSVYIKSGLFPVLYSNKSKKRMKFVSYLYITFIFIYEIKKRMK